MGGTNLGGGETDPFQSRSKMRIFSTDFGENWTVGRESAPAKNWNDLVWHDQTSRFVALSRDGYVSYSSDGELIGAHPLLFQELLEPLMVSLTIPTPE